MQVEDLLDEMGNPGIPLSVISKAAEMQLLYAVDKVILGNKWLRKATGIQPKFPYMVDSFEKRYFYYHPFLLQTLMISIYGTFRLILLGSLDSACCVIFLLDR